MYSQFFLMVEESRNLFSWSGSPPAAEYALAQYASFNSLLSRTGLGHHGKGWIVRGTTTRRLPYWSQRALLAKLEQVLLIYSLYVGSSVADCQVLT